MKISFVPFLCCFHLTNALYAIFHSRVEQDYIRMKRDYGGQDPLDLSNEIRRIRLCDKVLRANKFFYVYELADFAPDRRNSNDKSINQKKLNRHNAQLQNYSLGSTSKATEYNVKHVFIDSVVLKMRMFLCAEIANVEWYITFGFRTDHVFLLTKLKNADDTTLKMQAMLAPSPTLDTEISFVTVDNRRRVLDNYFWQFFKGEHTFGRSNNYYEVLRFMQMCWLAEDEYTYFEVCSSVAKTLSKQDRYRDELQLQVGKVNYVEKINAGSAGCVDGPLLDSRTGAVVNVRALGCAVNRGWSNPQFYLLRDPNFSFETSVFVLKPQAGVLMLIAYVDNVNALTNRSRIL